mmetsp:Transcript_11572/g.15657  ORF Transcript_11572/g.15657 Transcript_11572/m.15657 type:complete len:85 (+) Transcript_11572:1127-1381(+)
MTATSEPLLAIAIHQLITFLRCPFKLTQLLIRLVFEDWQSVEIGQISLAAFLLLDLLIDFAVFDSLHRVVLQILVTRHLGYILL